MSVAGAFNDTTAGILPPVGPARRARRAAPFSIRFSDSERSRLIAEAAGVPLGTYIKAKALGDALPARARRSGIGIQDRRALAQLVAVLGRSHLAGNLNQLARLAHVGSLPLTPEIEAELMRACCDVQDIRRLLLTALGLRPEAAP